MEHKTFDSSTRTVRLTLNAPYYNAILPTTALFEQEHISAYVDSLGHIEFFDGEGNSLVFVDVPVAKDPSDYGHSAQYGTVECTAENGVITFFMPVYGWHDHYPNCDGENDRWSRYTARWFRVIFNCASKEIAVLDR